jgi:type I restriction enzyme S subunit
MSFPRYESYKDSGVEWLGEVPAHWEVKRLKFLGEAIIGLTYDPSDIVDENDGTLVLRSSNVQNGQIVFDDNVFVKKIIPAKLITKIGDILICSRNGSRALIGKNAVIRNEAEGVTFGAFMTIFRSEYNVYLSYVFNSSLFEFQSGSFLTSTVNQLTTGNLYNFEVPLPSSAEQKQIDAFLDRETAKIDALIAEQQRLIELLKEKRQAVISHAVTKGLNPDAPMKDSGIEWLGEVPAHWAVAALNYRYDVALGKMLDEKRITGEHLAPYLRNADVQWGIINTIDLPEMDFKENDLDRYSLMAGDLLVCEGGEVGRAAIWNGELKECYYQKALHRLRPKSPASDIPKFMFYHLWTAACSGRFIGSEGRATIAHLTAEALRRYHFAFPPHDEQSAIVYFLDSETAKLDTLTAEAQRAIELLKERRAALISAAVTGKIDVRGLVALQPQTEVAA